MSALSPDDHFRCSICLDVFTDPVSTPCGHNVCRTCLNQHGHNGELFRCQVCNKRFDLRPECFKKTIISEISVQGKKRKIEMLEAHLECHQRIPSKMRHKQTEENLKEKVCEKHARILEFFCRHEQVCICLLCCKTEHKDHHIVPIKMEGEHQKQTIAPRQAKIKRMINERRKKIRDFADSSEKNKVKTEKEIKDSDKLFYNLIKKVKEIQDGLKSNMKEKLRKSQERDQTIIQTLHKEIADLQRKHSKLEELFQNEDHLQIPLTLQALNSTSDTTDWSKIMVSSDLCMESVRSAMSNLVHIFQRKQRTLTKKELKIRRHYKESVTFDPNTAGPYLVVNESGTRLKRSKTPNSSALSDNSQRFKSSMVFGKDCFMSGRHYWEVRVGWRNDWDVGVAMKTVDKTEEVIVKKENGFFSIGKVGFDYQVNCSPSKVLHLSPRPRHVGVYLDYEEGRVSFYDVDEKRHIYTVRVERFTGKLFPYFYMYSTVKKPGTLVITTT